MKSYALHTSEAALERRTGVTAMHVGAVAALVVGAVALVLSAIAFSDTQNLNQRIDSALDDQTLASNKHAVRNMISSSLAAHPHCGASLQACVDLMNITNHLATQNFTVGDLVSGAFSHQMSEAALLAHDGSILAKGPQLSESSLRKFAMPKSVSDCEMNFGNTCLLSNEDGHLMTLTLVNMHVPGGVSRRGSLATALENGFGLGSSGLGFGGSIGSALGTLISPNGGGSVMGEAIGQLAGGLPGFAAGLFNL